jgi:hypothetical protein
MQVWTTGLSTTAAMTTSSYISHPVDSTRIVGARPPGLHIWHGLFISLCIRRPALALAGAADFDSLTDRVATQSTRQTGGVP